MQRAYDIHGAFYGDSDIIIEVTVEDQEVLRRVCRWSVLVVARP